MLISTNLLI